MYQVNYGTSINGVQYYDHTITFKHMCNIFHLKRYPPLIHQVILHPTTYIFSFLQNSWEDLSNSLYWSLLLPESPSNQTLLHQNCSPSHQWPCCQLHWPILSPYFLDLISSIWQINGLHLREFFLHLFLKFDILILLLPCSLFSVIFTGSFPSPHF